MHFLEQAPYKSLLDDWKKDRKIIYLTRGGSHAYGTNVEGSDIDIRGVALKTKEELLGFKNFEQLQNKETDTTIYAVDKFFQLILNCNPNTIELLGTKDEHRFLVEPEMQLILDNKDVFLSQKAIKSFGGYATAQLRRLENAVERTQPQQRREEHMMNTVKNMQEHLMNHYVTYNPEQLKIYIDKTDRVDFETEMFIDINLKHYPLRDFKCIQSEMNQAVSNYDKASHRNNKKSEIKLDKHVMHLVRLYLMVFDILEKGEINTFRDKEHDILMSIRNGEWAEDNYKRLYSYLDELDKRFEYAKKNTILPLKPNYKRAEELLVTINEMGLK